MNSILEIISKDNSQRLKEFFYTRVTKKKESSIYFWIQRSKSSKSSYCSLVNMHRLIELFAGFVKVWQVKNKLLKK